MDYRKFDVRVVRRYLDKGMVTLEAYEKELASLPDVSAQSVRLETNFGARSETVHNLEADTSAEAEA